MLSDVAEQLMITFFNNHLLYPLHSDEFLSTAAYYECHLPDKNKYIVTTTTASTTKITTTITSTPPSTTYKCYSAAATGFVVGFGVKNILDVATIDGCRAYCTANTECKSFHYSSPMEECGLKSTGAPAETRSIEQKWQQTFVYAWKVPCTGTGTETSKAPATTPTAGVQCASMSGSDQHGKCTQAGCLFDTSTKVCSATTASTSTTATSTTATHTTVTSTTTTTSTTIRHGGGGGGTAPPQTEKPSQAQCGQFHFVVIIDRSTSKKGNGHVQDAVAYINAMIKRAWGHAAKQPTGGVQMHLSVYALVGGGNTVPRVWPSGKDEPSTWEKASPQSRIVANDANQKDAIIRAIKTFSYETPGTMGLGQSLDFIFTDYVRSTGCSSY